MSSGRVFLTGANGFVASHILSILVERHYHIVASVRTTEKAEQILQLHPTWKPNITFVYISDITAESAYNEAFEKHGDFDYIIHNASPLNFSAKDIHEEIVRPAIEGTTGLISAAHKYGGTKLKRFVLLGSSVAIQNEFDDYSKEGKPYTEDDWNPVTEEYAIKNNSIVAGYDTSKKLAEQAAWKFMDEQKPHFDLAVMNPERLIKDILHISLTLFSQYSIIIGPMLQYCPGPKSVNETNMFAIYNFLNGTYSSIDDLKFPFYHFVDVRNVALAHVLALTAPSASNKRIILISDLISPQLVINTIRKNFPDLKNRVIEGNPGQLLPPGVHPTGWDTSRSHEVFGPEWKYIGLEESVIDTVKSILEHEKTWEKNDE